MKPLRKCEAGDDTFSNSVTRYVAVRWICNMQQHVTGICFLNCQFTGCDKWRWLHTQAHTQILKINLDLVIFKKAVVTEAEGIEAMLSLKDSNL